jgi:hypothetical protein
VILAFYQNVIEQFDAIEDCLAKRRVIPCLSLAYSTLDVFALAGAHAGRGKNSFCTMG